VFNLLSDPSPKLRTAAAELAAGMIYDVGKKAIKGSRKVFNKKGKKGQKAHDATDSESELAGVLSVLRSLSSTGEDEQSIPLPETIVFFVVSSLSHRVSALSNWHLMVDWLLNDVAFNILGEDSTLDLAKCFLCAVKSSADPSRVKGVTKEKRKAIDSAKQEVTLLLQKELPNLLIKFQSEPDLLAAVCRVIPYMKIELYSLKRQEASLATLLGTLKDSFFRHADLGCLSSCAHALAHCSRLGKDSVKDIAVSVLGETVTQVSRDMAEAVKCMNKIGFVEMGKLGDHYRETNGTEGSVELFQICSAFSRASAIEEAHPMAFVDDESAQTSLRTLLRLASEGWDIPAKAVFDAERSLLLLLLSNLAMYNHQDSDQSKGDALAEARIDLTSRMHAIIETAIGSGYKDVAITVSNHTILHSVLTFTILCY
jgi:cohesin complex subunit SA-1/2